jgi:hypothetical protein
VHILCDLSKLQPIATLIKDKNAGPALQSFYWQNGYGAFSISPSHVAALKRYILNQKEHHRAKRFRTSSGGY